MLKNDKLLKIGTVLVFVLVLNLVLSFIQYLMMQLEATLCFDWGAGGIIQPYLSILYSILNVCQTVDIIRQVMRNFLKHLRMQSVLVTLQLFWVPAAGFDVYIGNTDF